MPIILTYLQLKPARLSLLTKEPALLSTPPLENVPTQLSPPLQIYDWGGGTQWCRYILRLAMQLLHPPSVGADKLARRQALHFTALPNALKANDKKVNF